MDQAIQERTVIAMDAVDSSQINAIGYDAATKTISIQFKNFKGEADA